MTAASGKTYEYDENGNMTVHTVSGQTYNFAYDAENHLTAVSGAAQASFGYNGDGQRVAATEGITTTVFVGNYFEWQVASEGVVTTTEATKYYYAGGTRVAMQRGGEGVKYLLGDHLGSASVALNADGTERGAQGYRPWGEVNFTEGTIGTEYAFQGQYSYVSSFGMAYFNARWFLPELGRFSQPDSIVPEQQQGTIAWDRLAGLNNNPVRFSDPTGHAIAHCDNPGLGCGGGGAKEEHDITNSEEVSEDDDTFFDEFLKQMLWSLVPSTIGWHGNLSWQVGAGLEPGSFIQIDIVINLLTGQVSILLSSGPVINVGVPTFLTGTLGAGPTIIYGSSDNRYLEGGFAFVGGTISGDALGALGLAADVNVPLLPDGGLGTIFVDPVSERSIAIVNFDVLMGISAALPGIVAQLKAGGGGTTSFMTFTIPNWPIHGR